MCKVMIIPRIEDTEKVKRFMEAAHPHMSKTDSDGIGYAAVTTDGDYAIERWFDVKKAFERPWKETKLEEKIIGQLKKFLKKEHDKDSFEYNYHGDLDKNWKSVLYHTRYATCEKNLKNVHPFLSKDGNSVLIHNGKISNHDENKDYCPIQSTCDSEAILNAYTFHDVANNIKEWQQIASNLKGYYAVGVISKNKEGKFILDVTRDRSASLYCVYIPAIKSEVFCTKIDIVKEACQKLNWKYGTFYEIEENVVFRYDVDSSELLETFEYQRSFTYTSKGYTSGSYNNYYKKEWYDDYRYNGGTSHTSSVTSKDKEDDDVLTLEEIKVEMEDVEKIILEAEEILGISSEELSSIVNQDGDSITLEENGVETKYKKVMELGND